MKSERNVVVDGKAFIFEPVGSGDAWYVWLVSPSKKVAEIVWGGELHQLEFDVDETVLVRACEAAGLKVRLPKRQGAQ